MFVRRRGRVFVVCAKVPKHKQRQGLHHDASAANSGEEGGGLAAVSVPSLVLRVISWVSAFLHVLCGY